MFQFKIVNSLNIFFIICLGQVNFLEQHVSTYFQLLHSHEVNTGKKCQAVEEFFFYVCLYVYPQRFIYCKEK